MSWIDVFSLLALNALFIGLLSASLVLKAHGAADSDLSALRNIIGGLGTGILAYTGWLFYKIMGKSGGPPKL